MAWDTIQSALNGEEVSRRKFLAATGSAAAAGLAGCSSGEDPNTTEPNPTDTETQTPTETETTTEETETTTEEPEGPIYVKFNPIIDNELRSQIPEEHREELQQKGFDLNSAYTDSHVLNFNPEEHDINTVEIGLDLIGLRQLHYNEFENLQTWNGGDFSPEMEIHKHAALGNDQQIPEQHREDVEEAKNLDGWPGGASSYSVEEAMSASTVEEQLMWTEGLYTVIEHAIDSGRNSVEDLKHAAVLEEIMDVGSDLNGHFWMTKVNQGAHGFNLAYDEQQDKIIGIDSVKNGVVDYPAEPIEEVGYADQGTVPWNYDGTGNESIKAHAVGTMVKMVTSIEDGDLLNRNEIGATVTNELAADTMEMLRNYNSNDAEFEEIFERSLQLAAADRAEGKYVGGFNEEGEILYRQTDESTMTAVHEDETGEYDDFTHIEA